MTRVSAGCSSSTPSLRRSSRGAFALAVGSALLLLACGAGTRSVSALTGIPAATRASDARDDLLLQARRLLLQTATKQFPRGPKRRHQLLLAQAWGAIGGDKAQGLAHARAAHDIEWQAALGACDAMSERYGDEKPAAVANGCARAGAIEQALALAAKVRPDRTRGALTEVVRRFDASDLTAAHAKGLAWTVTHLKPAPQNSTHGITLETETARLLVEARQLKLAHKLLIHTLGSVTKVSAGVGHSRRVASLARVVMRTYRQHKPWTATFALSLDSVARKSIDPAQASVMSAMWSAMANQKRAVWWLRAGLAALSRHTQAHERLQLGCGLAGRAVALERTDEFGQALGISEAAAREMPAAMRSQAWECIGAAMLLRGDVESADAIATAYQTHEVRQAIIIQLARSQRFDAAVAMAQRDAPMVTGRTFATLYRMAPSHQHRYSVLQQIKALNDRATRVRALTRMGQHARSDHRRAEALQLLELAMESAEGRGIARNWFGPGSAAAKRMALIQLSLANPATGIPRLLSVRSGPMYMPPRERFAALMAMAQELRWQSGVDLKALIAALKKH